MPDIVMLILLFGAVAVYVLPQLLIILQMFQQNHYELERYADWQRDNLSSVFMDFIFVTVPGFLFLFIGLFKINRNVVVFLMSIILLAAGFLWQYMIKQKAVIKPLVITARVIRLIIAFMLIGGLKILILWHFFPGQLGIIALLPWLNYWFLYPVALLTEPLEDLIKRGYTRKAEDILADRDDLIRIGITGSYGKTSTKHIVSDILGQKYNTLMTPASYNTPMGIVKTVRELLRPIHEIFVCEMGADKAGDISDLMSLVKPQIGIVTAIGPQHLATFKTQENIIKEKMQMVEKLPEDGWAVLNYDNEFIREYLPENKCNIVSYGISSAKADYRATDIVFSQHGSTFKIQAGKEKYRFSTKLLGRHNILNILAAVAVGRKLDISWKRLQTAVAKTGQIEHRLEIKPYGIHTMIDDAFNANPEGSLEALQVLSMMPKPRYLITCGMIDLGSKQDEMNYKFGQAINNNADRVILVGEKQSAAIYEGLLESGYDHTAIHVVNSTLAAFFLLNQLSPKKPVTFLVENDLPDAFNR